MVLENKEPHPLDLVKPFHRGAYEHLWAEHRHPAQANSIKSFQNGCSKLGRTPHVLGLLRLLTRLAEEPIPLLAHSLLAVYEEIRETLDRDSREKLVNRILTDTANAAEDLFREIRDRKRTLLYGCRLFFPRHPVFKFWDFGDQPGLWLCLGPTQVAIPFSQFRFRLENGSRLSSPELDSLMARLSKGVSRAEYDGLPPGFRMTLENHCAIALGGNLAMLHPRIPVPLPPSNRIRVTPEHAGYLALERVWDRLPGSIPELPSFQEWSSEFSPERLPDIEFDPSPEPGTLSARVFGEIIEAFSVRIEIEAGRKSPN